MKNWFNLLNVFLCGCMVVVMSLAGCANEQPKHVTVKAPAWNEVVATTTLLATIAEGRKGATQQERGGQDSSKAGSKPAPMIVEMNRYGKGFAYIEPVADQFRVVSNGKAGKLYKEIADLSLSPDGLRAGYFGKAGDKWVAVVDGKEFGSSSESGSISFSPDSRHFVHEGKYADKWYLDLDNIKSNGGALSYFDTPLIVGNSDKIVCVEITDQSGAGIYRLVVSDLLFKKIISTEITSPGLVTVDRERTMVAAVEKNDNKQRVVSLHFDQADRVNRGGVFDEIVSLAVSRDGKVVSYIARRDGKNFLVLNDKEEQLPAGEFPAPPVIRPDGKGAGLVVFGPNGAYILQAFQGGGIREGRYKECAELAYSGDGLHHAYIAIKNEKFSIVVNGKEGPFFDRVIAPQFSPDGKFLVYSARQGDKRFVVVADVKGKIIRQHPGYERIFDKVFTADGKAVAYGAKDGNRLWWKVEAL